MIKIILKTLGITLGRDLVLQFFEITMNLVLFESFFIFGNQYIME